MGLVALLGLVVLLLPSSGMHEGTQSKPPQSLTSPATLSAIIPDLHVRRLLGVPAKKLKDALETELGSAAKIRRYKMEGQWLWYARTKNAHLELWEFKGKIATFIVAFDRPAQDRAAALAMIDLAPYDLPPTTEVPREFRWEAAFANIDRVRAIIVMLHGERQPIGSAQIDSISITPNRQLEDENSAALR